MDDFSSLVQAATPKANPFSGLAQGIESGRDWAAKKAEIDLKRRTLMEQMQRHEQQKREFEYKSGIQFIDRAKDIAVMENGPYKTSLLDALNEDHKRAFGSDISPTLIKGLTDNDFAKRYAKVITDLQSQMGMSSDPTKYEKMFGMMSRHMSDTFLINQAEQLPQMMKLQESISRNQRSFDYKQNKDVDTAADKLKKDLDPDAARTGNFGTISKTFLQAQKLKALATDSAGKTRNLTPAENEELAIGMANMLSAGGIATDSRIKGLVPKTAMGDASKFAQWFLNNPTGQNQQAFTKYTLGTINREADVAKKQMTDIQKSRLPSHQWLKQMAPDVYKATLSGYGLDEDGQPAGDGKQLASGGLSKDEATMLQGALSDPKTTPKQKKVLLDTYSKKAGFQIENAKDVQQYITPPSASPTGKPEDRASEIERIRSRRLAAISGQPEDTQDEAPSQTQTELPLPAVTPMKAEPQATAMAGSPEATDTEEDNGD